MDWKTVGSKVSKVAPIIGTLLGGPLGGAAGTLVSLIASEFGLNPEETTPEKVDQIITQNPEALLKFREMEMANKVELQKILLEETRAYLADRADARGRQVGSEKATGKRDYNLYLLAWTVITGFFLLCVALMRVTIPEGQNEVVFMLFGALAAGFGNVLQYFFGSSKGSYDKTAFMAQQATKTTAHDKAGGEE